MGSKRIELIKEVGLIKMGDKRKNRKVMKKTCLKCQNLFTTKAHNKPLCDECVKRKFNEWCRKKYHKNIEESRYKLVLEQPRKYQLLCANCNWIKRFENKEHRTYKSNIIFICSANVNRSKAFEREFNKLRLDYNCKSAGIWHGYPDQLNKTLLEWTDYLFVMDLSHEVFISKKYPEHLKKVEVIGISDQYDVDDPELVDLFHYWFNRHWISVEK